MSAPVPTDAKVEARVYAALAETNATAGLFEDIEPAVLITTIDAKDILANRFNAGTKQSAEAAFVNNLRFALGMAFKRHESNKTDEQAAEAETQSIIAHFAEPYIEACRTSRISSLLHFRMVEEAERVIAENPEPATA